MIWLGQKPGHRRTAIERIVCQRLRDFGSCCLVIDTQSVVGPGLPAQFNRYSLFSPGTQFIRLAAELPFVNAVAAVVEDTLPMSLSGVAGTGKTECIFGVAPAS